MTEPQYWEMLVKKSVSRYLLLDMLARRPMYGYEVAKEIETCCEGWCKPTPGMIYPTFKNMVGYGYIECTEDTIGGRVRKICHLTDRGREAERRRGTVGRCRGVGQCSAVSHRVSSRRDWWDDIGIV